MIWFLCVYVEQNQTIIIQFWMILGCMFLHLLGCMFLHLLLDGVNWHPILDDSSHPLLDGVNWHQILDDSTTVAYFSIYPLDHNVENRYIHYNEYLILQFITTTTT